MAKQRISITIDGYLVTWLKEKIKEERKSLSSFISYLILDTIQKEAEEKKRGGKNTRIN